MTDSNSPETNPAEPHPAEFHPAESHPGESVALEPSADSPPPVVVDNGTEVRDRILAVRQEVAKVVVGQDGAVSGLISALLIGGHVLLEGVPGVAKTLLVKTIAQALSLDFARVQFTPDLMPSDITGQTVYNAQSGDFEFRAGPVFTNFLLADEINRTPPKTQAALLEAMEESQVSVGGDTRKLPDPFLTVATQNPVEYEGTYPLPEAQLDRFLFKIIMDYPSADQEFEVVARHHYGLDTHDVASAGVQAIANRTHIAQAQQQVRDVQVDDRVIRYIVELCRATRNSSSVALGVSPRGAAALLHATKAWTWLSGTPFATPDEVQIIAPSVLRHRMMLRPELELEGASADSVLNGIIAAVPAPR